MLLSAAQLPNVEDVCGKYRGQYPRWETIELFCTPYVYHYTWTHSPILSSQLSACSCLELTIFGSWKEKKKQKMSYLTTHALTHIFPHSQFNPCVWGCPWLGSSRVLMANGADMVMSDQSSCFPSQQHISNLYKFNPLAQAEDLDAYLMFIFYRSCFSKPVHGAKSLKRRQSPCEANSCIFPASLYTHFSGCRNNEMIVWWLQWYVETISQWTLKHG